MKPQDIAYHTDTLNGELTNLRLLTASLSKPIDRSLFTNAMAGARLLITQNQFGPASAIIATLNELHGFLQPMGRNFSETQPDIEEK